MVDARANTSEHQAEVLALVIDRETSASASRINKEIGSSVVHWSVPARFRGIRKSDQLNKDWDAVFVEEQRKIRNGEDASYEGLLLEYVELKLYLHGLRRSMYYRGDPYVEREDIDVQAVLQRCDDLKEQIKAHRRTMNYATWGDLTPPKHSPYDKPLLYAFDEHICSFVTDWQEEDVHVEPITCPLKGTHWYEGRPYCRAHFGETRSKVKLARRMERSQRWAEYCEKHANCPPGCTRTGRHVHRFSGVDDFKPRKSHLDNPQSPTVYSEQHRGDARHPVEEHGSSSCDERVAPLISDEEIAEIVEIVGAQPTTQEQLTARCKSFGGAFRGVIERAARKVLAL